MKKTAMLVLAALAICSSIATAQSTTIVISPVPGNPQASADLIVDALASIQDNGPTKPYLIRIDPGIYDLGSQSLAMKPWIDIEGSGRDITKLTALGRSDFSDATVLTADNSELRKLTVESRGSGHEAALGVLVQQTSARLSDMTIRSTGANSGCDGVLIRQGHAELSRVSIFVSGSTTTTGIAVELDSSALMDQVDIEARDASSINRAVLAIDVDDRFLDIRSSRFESHGGNMSYGMHLLFNVELRVALDNVDIVANQATSTNAGIHSQGAERFEISDSRIVAAGGVSSYGFLGSVTNRLKVDNSFVAGQTSTIQRLDAVSTAQVGGTKLSGGPVAGNVTCAGVWNKSYVFFASSCP